VNISCLAKIIVDIENLLHCLAILLYPEGIWKTFASLYTKSLNFEDVTIGRVSSLCLSVQVWLMMMLLLFFAQFIAQNVKTQVIIRKNPHIL
jgi:hypothetical protein